MVTSEIIIMVEEITSDEEKETLNLMVIDPNLIKLTQIIFQKKISWKK